MKFFSDIIVFSEDITRLPLSFRISRITERLLLINTATILFVKILLAILGAASVMHTGTIAGIDCMFGVAACIYALTCFTLEKRSR